MRTLFLKLQLISLLIISCKPEEKKETLNQTTYYIKGADASFITEVRKSGMVFYNKEGLARDMLTTLKESGVNVIRLRLWHTPSEKGCDLQTISALCREIKNIGLQTMITVHYSDTWADPANQTKPEAWKNCNTGLLADSIYQYTKNVVAELHPDYIQIGNEINGGLLWPEGKTDSLNNMKLFLKKGVQAVRETDPHTRIILHLAGYNSANWFFSQIKGLDFDLIGLSYYPVWHGKNTTELKETMQSLSATTGKPVFIAETSYPFTLSWNDFTNNVIGLDSQLLPGFPATPEGQLAYLNHIKSISTEFNGGYGFCYWGGEWVSYKGKEATNGSTWENQAFWDFSNKALPVLNAY